MLAQLNQADLANQKMIKKNPALRPGLNTKLEEDQTGE
jgi:hypothetical protein